MPYSIRVDISDGNIFETSQNLHEQMNTCGYIEQFDQPLRAKLMEDKAFNSNKEIIYSEGAIKRASQQPHLHPLPPITCTSAGISSIAFLIHSDDFLSSSCFSEQEDHYSKGRSMNYRTALIVSP